MCPQFFFVVLRFTAASLLAEQEAIGKEVMVHRHVATTPAHERLADAVLFADLVTCA